MLECYCIIGPEVKDLEKPKIVTRKAQTPPEVISLGLQQAVVHEGQSGRSQRLRKRMGQPCPPNPSGPRLIFCLYSARMR